MKKQIRSLRLAVLSLFLCIIASLLVLPSMVYAELPPRPTRAPAESEDRELEQEVQTLPLILQVTPGTNEVWAAVQWQDAQGKWHDVSGWRGSVVHGRAIWWVEEKDFGKGPFRWVVYQKEGGERLQISQPFNLPTESSIGLTIYLSL